ncbi:orotidine-5'-phosphate decarboxylase [Actinobacteria bacterium YIM 96077]|uniref:Orotidine 5'-phosphate decarboxylase n=1 Tax=Phytoactinopolyspora halophila TaxID=1981511 RepID=A0A329QJG5_9ACTN|nr:orotidine-5'-phosphate decarboxylase [Phytoactinopolyspora halophila]AYY15514.1 orotidine-5'-phosphate decarboxylase [Actinobacteria bacterium YIM 96077]RAW12464.1 orotidine-5'-phosphate decarboxylase [Phytoactinopolyspora halophila]
MTFGERLHRAMRDRGPLCVGIDPHAALLDAWRLADDVNGLETFARTVVEALAADVAVLKPQAAFFERHGSRGIAVLERVIAEARDAGALVLVDAKRGDIGSTMQAYADAFLRPSSPLCSDAVTASPYLGFGALRPLIDTALEHGNGVFVLARTSNPEGDEVQGARTADGRSVAGAVLDHARAVNAGATTWGSIGCVVGATVTLPAGEDLQIGGPLLAPGVGAQGATVADLAGVFGAALPSVLPNVSRDILRHGPDRTTLVSAARAMNSQVTDLLIGEDAGERGNDHDT